MINIPVAYIIFNRPRHTREIFATICAQHPVKLIIIADGPNSSHPMDVDAVVKYGEELSKSTVHARYIATMPIQILG